MPYEISFEKIEYQCGVDGCDFKIEIKNPNDLTLDDFALLNQLIDPEFVPSAQELDRLNQLLDGKIACPDHGRQNVGFTTLQKHTVSAEYVLDLGENEDGDQVIILTPEPAGSDEEDQDNQ